MRKDLYKWCLLTGFIMYTLGVLSGMGIVWVNDNWTPWFSSEEIAAETVAPEEDP